MIFYKIIKALEYETANPGQDWDAKEATKYRPQTEPNSNSSGPPGVERVHSSRSQHGRSDGALQDTTDSRDFQRDSAMGNTTKFTSAKSQRQYRKGPQAERGEMPYSRS